MFSAQASLMLDEMLSEPDFLKIASSFTVVNKEQAVDSIKGYFSFDVPP